MGDVRPNENPVKDNTRAEFYNIQVGNVGEWYDVPAVKELDPALVMESNFVFANESLMMTFENSKVPLVLQSVVNSNLILSKAFHNFFSSIFISESYYLIGCQDVDRKSTKIVRLARTDWQWYAETFSLQGTARLKKSRKTCHSW